ncbi:MAG: hypothetical protein GWN11_03540 [Candidatus Dadabacteria bacterium]|nr:hypothetical protein [Candidatus Dadabacteria bacterium]NIX14962.1 hypothetical protein [Candidatus Dadabacteria bacterium]
MRTSYITLPVLIIAISFLAGCSGKWQNPNDSVAAQELKIRNLLITPTIYDHAGVILEGKVWDLDFIEDPENADNVYSMFKLADKDGNYVNVTSEGMTTLLQEGERIKVIGIHRVLYSEETRLVSYLVDAKQILPPSTFHY